MLEQDHSQVLQNTENNPNLCSTDASTPQMCSNDNLQISNIVDWWKSWRITSLRNTTQHPQLEEDLTSVMVDETVALDGVPTLPPVSVSYLSVDLPVVLEFVAAPISASVFPVSVVNSVELVVVMSLTHVRSDA